MDQPVRILVSWITGIWFSGVDCANERGRTETQEREAKHCQLPLDENVPQGGWT